MCVCVCVCMCVKGGGEERREKKKGWKKEVISVGRELKNKEKQLKKQNEEH